MAGCRQSIIVAIGKSWTAGNGDVMRRRFQHGRVFKRGKRRKVWLGRFYEPLLVHGKLSKKRRSIIVGLCSDMTRGQAKNALLEHCAT
jgi:hypothetical protein